MIGDPYQVLAFVLSNGQRHHMRSALPDAPVVPGRGGRVRMARLRLRGAAALRVAACRLEAPVSR